MSKVHTTHCVERWNWCVNDKSSILRKREKAVSSPRLRYPAHLNYSYEVLYNTVLVQDRSCSIHMCMVLTLGNPLGERCDIARSAQPLVDEWYTRSQILMHAYHRKVSGCTVSQQLPPLAGLYHHMF
jgi:hypothetical protein